MPRMSKKSKGELLLWMGWKKDGKLWTHSMYQPEPAEMPDLNTPDQLTWLMSWILTNGYVIRFTAYQHPNFNEFFCIVKSHDGQKKWTVKDYHHLRPHNALLSAILKIKRFPAGMPKKKKDYLQALVESKNKEFKTPGEALTRAKNKLRNARMENDVKKKDSSSQRPQS